MRSEAVFSILIASALLGCERQAALPGGPKSETIVIVGKAEIQDGIEWNKVCVVGRWSLDTNPATGKLEPSNWRTGNLYLFHATQELPDEFAKGCGMEFSTRLDTQLPAGFSARAGVVYRVTSDRKLEEVGQFDGKLKRTVTELATEYLAR